MGEYFNLFLNWLNNVARFATYNDYPGNRIAPRAEDRYANSEEFDTTVKGFPFTHNAEGFILRSSDESALSNMFSHKQRPALITRYVSEPGDTVYQELPESDTTLGGFLDYRYPRTASTNNKKGDEYDILKRRYFTAKKLAKKKKK